MGGKFMYGINIFDRIRMPLDWAIVYCGINSNLLSIDIAHEFACRKLENGEQMSEEELELSWNSNNRLDVLELLEKILNMQGNVDENVKNAKDRIRTALIIYMRDTEKDLIRLLEQIAIIYAEFDYPTDMENFIIYMPNNDDHIRSYKTHDDNKKLLLCKLDAFIENKVKEYQLRRGYHAIRLEEI